MRQNSIPMYNKCISEKVLDSNLESVCILFTFLTTLLQIRKLLSWIFCIDRDFACDCWAGVEKDPSILIIYIYACNRVKLIR